MSFTGTPVPVAVGVEVGRAGTVGIAGINVVVLVAEASSTGEDVGDGVRVTAGVDVGFSVAGVSSRTGVSVLVRDAMDTGEMVGAGRTGAAAVAVGIGVGSSVGIVEGKNWVGSSVTAIVAVMTEPDAAVSTNSSAKIGMANAKIATIE
jgi:hypothetical protein